MKCGCKTQHPSSTWMLVVHSVKWWPWTRLKLKVMGFCFSTSDSFFWWSQSESLKCKWELNGIVVLMQSGGKGVKVMLMQPTLASQRHVQEATSRILWTLSTNQRGKSSSQVAFWFCWWIFLDIHSLETSELCRCGPWCCCWDWQMSLIVSLQSRTFANVLDCRTGPPSVCLHWYWVEGTEGEKRCFCHLLRVCIFCRHFNRNEHRALEDGAFNSDLEVRKAFQQAKDKKGHRESKGQWQ